MKLVGPRLVIFDLDGTLVDSRLDLPNAVNRVLEDVGRPTLPVETELRAEVTEDLGEGRYALKVGGQRLEIASATPLTVGQNGQAGQQPARHVWPGRQSI